MSSRHVFVRPARPEDAKLFLDWSLETKSNEFDPEVARTPSTLVMCAFDREGPLAFLPVQQVLMLDSIASRPNASRFQTAQAMKELVQATVTQAYVKGVGEIYFLGSDDGTNEFATNQVFEKLPYSVYRLKVKQLEG